MFTVIPLKTVFKRNYPFFSNVSCALQGLHFLFLIKVLSSDNIPYLHYSESAWQKTCINRRSLFGRMNQTAANPMAPILRERRIRLNHDIGIANWFSAYPDIINPINSPDEAKQGLTKVCQGTRRIIAA